jgi:hypothetical protein
MLCFGAPRQRTTHGAKLRNRDRKGMGT